MITEESFTTTKAGVLTIGKEFRMKLVDDGNFGVFRFRGHYLHENGSEHISCYGGDADPKGRRQWHSFDTERVRTQALPPGSMSTRRA